MLVDYLDVVSRSITSVLNVLGLYDGKHFTMDHIAFHEDDTMLARCGDYLSFANGNGF